MEDASARKPRRIRATTARSRAADVNDSPPARSFRVQLPHLAPQVVEGCKTATEAFERYKQAHGICHSDHEPLIEAVKGE